MVYTSSKRRYFKLLNNGHFIGRFYGITLTQVANKVLSSMFKRNYKLIQGKFIKFDIKECTRGGEQMVYKYRGMRCKLVPPKLVDFLNKNNAKRVYFKYKNIVNQR
jgi:hypothetical protein